MSVPRKISELSTPRLKLRAWKESDLAPFAALNADPRVMEYFPSCLSRAQSDTVVGRIRDHFGEHGFGFWAVEAPGVAPFIGFVGLKWTSADVPFPRSVEVGWRLAHDFWGKGYATEAAREAVRFGFEDLRLEEIVAFTYRGNFRSRRVMEKIGMHYSASDDFDFPALEMGHWLRPHVLYRLKKTTA